MKYSKQRELIQNTVLENRIHPTADDVYNMLKPIHTNLSLGTVYRNLNTLVENGTIIKISMPNGSDRYDGDLSKHDHMVCDQCGKVFDIKTEGLLNIVQKIENTTDFEVRDYQLMIHGLCHNCKESKG
ncbi:MAG: transcriptional repressor [Oscillospiraceae bacterium]|jgi:Fur family peroxide stress response transcriptional regulator|nr:transcriptional repressor [Oscillospiraceae bacterium]